MDLSKSLEVFNPNKYTDRIHIIGCGSVGATIAENLVRHGLTAITLWDFDEVESKNLANQIFRFKDVGKRKVDALKDILTEINPEAEKDIKVKPKGWSGDVLNGFVFMCVDSIDTRREIVTVNRYNPFMKALFDFRTGLYTAQHFAADWSDDKMKQNLLNSMNFTNEDAKVDTPVSACNIELSVCPTIRTICALGVANFANFWNDKPLKKMILVDVYGFDIEAY